MPSQSMHPLDKFFSPNTVAVVGVSSKPGKIGHEIFRCMLKSGFQGRIYPVGRADLVLGEKCYQSIAEIPEKVDLAVYALQPDLVPPLLEEAGVNGVRNAIIVSGGFKETGKLGATLEEKLIKISRKHGIRIIGPNCIGVFDGETRLDTFFYPPEKMKRPKAGRLSFITQSGTFGVTFLEWAYLSSLGVRRLISIGNKCDVDEVELLRYLASDPKTDVIALHLESISNGRELVEVARDISSSKHIVIYKSGKTETGVKAAMSHTGSLAGSYEIAIAAFQEAGIIIANSFEDLFDKSKALVRQPPAKGNRIAIVTNCAGPSVTAADLAHEMGLKISLSPRALESLRESLPPYANIGLYVDLTGSATSEDFRKSLDIVLKDPETDLVTIFVVFVNAAITPDVVDVIVGALDSGKPVLCYSTGGDYSLRLINRLEEQGVSTYPTSERLMNAVKALVEAGRPRVVTKALPTIDANREEATRIIREAVSKGQEMLTEAESKRLLRTYGIRTTTEKLATTASEAASFAREIGFPVVMKIASPDIVHKSEIGGVITNIGSAAEASEAFERIIRNVKDKQPNARIYGVLVEDQLPPGVELLIGSIFDAHFGPVVVFGMGGILTEIFRDISFGLAPLDKQGALRMINATKAGKMLSGVRGQPPADLEALTDMIMRVSLLVSEQGIVEMDLNPVIASSWGCAVADARIRCFRVS